MRLVLEKVLWNTLQTFTGRPYFAIQFFDVGLNSDRAHSERMIVNYKIVKLKVEMPAD